jgi:hypothetical protein
MKTVRNEKRAGRNEKRAGIFRGAQANCARHVRGRPKERSSMLDSWVVMEVCGRHDFNHNH